MRIRMQEQTLDSFNKVLMRYIYIFFLLAQEIRAIFIVSSTLSIPLSATILTVSFFCKFGTAWMNAGLQQFCRTHFYTFLLFYSAF
ncbi:hypothetical protein CKR_2299 [Clostridium kluyveri NBRC 12016]|uniref:Uncharacterized protein n=1 Tax=Clostridium kluyveri (strain NBRC 12016) TaxID=583346 RepID=B9E4C5_CLOK1|nr:hypothetical protein CKR_2299 [Clostridium kluyveri NBRC 12016]